MEKTVQTNNYGDVKLVSEVDIVELITKLRNDIIRDFLDERFLKEYFQNKYHISDISNVKLELIKKDLKELYMSPVNTDHYKPIIEEIQTHDHTSLAEDNEQLFFKEVEGIFHKYF